MAVEPLLSREVVRPPGSVMGLSSCRSLLSWYEVDVDLLLCASEPGVDDESREVCN